MTLPPNRKPPTAWRVAKHEFLTAVRRKAFIWVTLGMPLTVVLYGLFVAGVSFLSVKSAVRALQTPIGVVDDSGLLGGRGGLLHDKPFDVAIEVAPPQPALVNGLGRSTRVNVNPPRDPTQLTNNDLLAPERWLDSRWLMRLRTLDAAVPALQHGQVRAVVRIPQTFVKNGQLEVYRRETSFADDQDSASTVERLLREHLLAKNQASQDASARILRPATVESFSLDGGDTFVSVDPLQRILKTGVPAGTEFLLLVALMMNATLLLASVAEEKENRVLEILLSSVSPADLLLGKVVGLVLAGLLQVVIWVSMVAAVPLIIMAFQDVSWAYEVPWAQMVTGAVFAVLGFLLYGCLLTGLGSLGATYREVQQLSAFVIFCPTLPLLVWPSFIHAPHGGVARFLSWFPLFSPSGMMLRVGVAPVNWGETLGALAVLVLSIPIALWLATRLFAVGTLLYTESPSWREIGRILWRGPEA